MRLRPLRVEIDGEPSSGSRPLGAGDDAEGIGAIEVRLEPADLAGTRGWSVTNTGREPEKVRSVSLVFSVEDARPPVRMLRHGYQSWSPTDVATLGVDSDPSRKPDSIELVRAASHADQRAARPGELRSEWVTVLADAATPAGSLLVGAAGGSTHDGTLRLTLGAEGEPELRYEAFLGDAVLVPGAIRSLHDLVVLAGEATSASELLDLWSAEVARRERARSGAPYVAGWCSWYHYFHVVTESDIRHNLALADGADWPFDVFQVDDGFQRAIGDWLDADERFSAGLETLAEEITGSGRRAGIWLAPFLAAPDSALATEHPDWLARLPNGEFLPGCFNPPWGGGLGGLMWTLDTTNPAVLEHLEHTGRELVQMGFRYLKLDFTYAPSFDGKWFDPTRTPSERVRAGYEAVRRGAGDDVFLLGCGAPLSNVVGVVDGMRIGADVAPAWNREQHDPAMSGYEAMLPATRHAAAATFARSFMHRRFWLNDPDCLMLRREATSLTPEQIETWTRVVEASGGMALVSDDLALVPAEARRRFDELLQQSRAVDAVAAAGQTPRCTDLMTASRQPSTLVTRGARLRVDPAAGSSSLDRLPSQT